MTLFEQGRKDFLASVKIKSQTSYKAEYLRGWQWGQKLSKGNSASWGAADPKYKSSSDIKNWALG